MLKFSIWFVALVATARMSAARPDFAADTDNNIGTVNEYASNVPQNEMDKATESNSKTNNDDYDGLYENAGSQQQQNYAYERDKSTQNSGGKSKSKSNNNNNNKKNHQSLVKIIPQAQGPQKLNEIYYGGGQNDILLHLKFPADFSKLNPRNPNALFKWAETIGGVADNAAIKSVYGGNNGRYGADDNDDEYGNSARNKNSPGYAQLSTVPFSNDFYQEGYIDSKQSFSVGDKERILGRILMSCKVVDGDNSPFNATEVSHPDDDPRLASCQFAMSNNSSKPGFYFMVTNKSIWAVYSGRRFISKRKVGIRERYDSMVDLGLELDRRRAAVNYYVSGYEVWTVNALGVPPLDDGLTKTDVGTLDSPTVVSISAVSFSLGTGKFLDESDPYTQDPTRLMRILPAGSTFYSPSSVFYEPEPMHSRINYGQGAIMKIFKLLVVKTESKQLQQAKALSSVYGPSSYM